MDYETPPSLTLTNEPSEGWHHRIESQPKVIGRAVGANIPVPKRFRSVSRRHAEVWCDKRGCWIRDLGSRVGTRVNLVRIDKLSKAEIVPGDLVRLGDLEIQVVTGFLENDDLGDFGNLDFESDEQTVGFSALSTPQVSPTQPLSPAEVELMLWVSRGVLGDNDLGRLLHRSPNTVRTQVGSILRKLGLHSRGEIVGWLRRDGGSHRTAWK